MIPLDDPRNQAWFGDDGGDGTVDMSVDSTSVETPHDRRRHQSNSQPPASQQSLVAGESGATGLERPPPSRSAGPPATFQMQVNYTAAQCETMPSDVADSPDTVANRAAPRGIALRGATIPVQQPPPTPPVPAAQQPAPRSSPKTTSSATRKPGSYDTCAPARESASDHVLFRIRRQSPAYADQAEPCRWLAEG